VPDIDRASNPKGMVRWAVTKEDNMAEQGKRSELPEGAPGRVSLEGQEAEMVVGRTVEIQRSGVEQVQADVVHVTRGAVAEAEASIMEATQSAIGRAEGQNVTLTQAAAGVVVAQEAELQDSTVALLMARQVRGEARILFDVRAAAVFGVVAGFTAGLVNVLARRRG
jgi:hypothetical protein